MLYSELQCSEAIHKAVERMGFAEMTEIQEKTIPVMLAGRDVIAKAPTGTGKTCAFGIPVAEHIDPEKKYPQAVIMAPTRELAQQIAEELTELTYFMPEVQVACVYGGANMEKQARRLAEGCQIVVATPGRLMDHYKHHSIDLAHVTQVVLDEADEMADMGFLPAVRRIVSYTRDDRQTLLNHYLKRILTARVYDVARETELEPARQRLAKYAVFSKVVLGEQPLHIHGVLGDRARARLEAAGCTRTDDVAHAEAIITYCTSQTALEDAYFDEQGLVQAAGKVIRSQQDRGVVMLIDDRFGEQRVRQLLPRWWTPAH